MSREVTANEILFTEKWDIHPQHSFSLHKQSYSDGTCYYTLQDINGNWDIVHGGSDLRQILEQLLWEQEVDRANSLTRLAQDNEEIKRTYASHAQWMERVLDGVRNIYWKPIMERC